MGVGDWGEFERAHMNAKSGARMLYILLFEGLRSEVV